MTNDPGEISASEERRVLRAVTAFFTESRDFNGAPLRSLADSDDGDMAGLLDTLEALIATGQITVVTERDFVNPHIKPWVVPVERQLAQLRTVDHSHSCVYPEANAIRSAIDLSRYDDRPFTQRLHLGVGQLESFFFDLSVLEPYYGDPRFAFEFNDYNGSIGLTREFHDSEEVEDRDRSFMQTFGLGHDDRGARVVVVHLRYLHMLSPEHQRIWEARVSTRPCKMVYEYYQNGILAEWAEHVSFYSAFITEQVVINDMAQRMGRPPLFRKTFETERPREFVLFLRPTRKNFDAFVHVLDKMLSDNIDPAFFQGQVSDVERIEHPGNGFELRKRGTLAMLEEWLRSRWRVKDSAFPAEITDPFREVRKLRQKPAHAVGSDDYDRAYHQRQEELIERVYVAIRNLRLLFANHPATAEVEIPEWIKLGKIKHF